MKPSGLNRRALIRVAGGGATLAAGLGTPPDSTSAMIRLWGVQGVIANRDGAALHRAPGEIGVFSYILPDRAPVIVNQTSGAWFRVTSLGYDGWVDSWDVELTGRPSQAIYQGDTSLPRIALTFDCGSDYGFTDQILATLADNQINATFGVTGQWIEANPDGMRAIALAGHQVINHTLNHYSFTGFSTPGARPLSPAARMSQLQATERLTAKTTGLHTRPNWRPPFGDIDDGVLRDAGALGYTRTVLWDIDSLGWNALTADDIYVRIMSLVTYGSIILMHVGAASQDANALDALIRDLSASGYSLGTVDQVIG